MKTDSSQAKTNGSAPRPEGAPRGNANARKHGLWTLKRAVASLGNRILDKRTIHGRALSEWRDDLIRDPGGDISTQQDAIISLAIKTKLLLDSIDVWLLEQPTIINKKKKSIIAAAKERQIFADALSRYMGQLGLARRTKFTPLSEILSRDDKPEDGNGTAAEPEADTGYVRSPRNRKTGQFEDKPEGWNEGR